MYMALAIDGPSTLDRCSVHMCLGLRTEVPPVEALLDKRFLVQLSQVQAGRDRILLPISLSVSVALVVLLVLLGANPLSSATAVELGARLHMVPFGHRTCTTCRRSIQGIHKFFPCIVCMCCIRRIVTVHIHDKLVTYLLCPMNPMWHSTRCRNLGQSRLSVLGEFSKYLD